MKTITIFLSNGWVKVTLMLALLFCAGWYMCYESRKVSYLHESCPRCGSCEVLDFGEQVDGHHGYCEDCKMEVVYDE